MGDNAIQIEKVRNIGPKTAEWLQKINISTLDELEEAGALHAYRRLLARFPHKVSLNALWSIQAALLDLHWLELPAEIKKALLEQLEQSED